uniref:DUF5753 domain-containing protein n=1 Tax=Panagrellus redivivus TaxID=6233 RepID=A0A7E4VRD4_PANRE
MTDARIKPFLVEKPAAAPRLANPFLARCHTACRRGMVALPPFPTSPGPTNPAAMVALADVPGSFVATLRGAQCVRLAFDIYPADGGRRRGSCLARRAPPPPSPTGQA